MKKVLSGFLLILALLVTSCNPAPSTPEPLSLAATPTGTAPTATVPIVTPGPTATTEPLALSQPGSHTPGIRRNITYVDQSRNGRKVSLTIWYPAIAPAGAAPSEAYSDAEVDASAAPYPLILSTSKVGFIFGPHLASHGFVVAGINGLDTYLLFNAQMIQQPLDYLFVLENLAGNPPNFLAGRFDPSRTGVMGYSFDGLNALWLSGARIYPRQYFDFCQNPASIGSTPPDWYTEYICNLVPEWADFETAAVDYVDSADELWKPMTDPRILAVMPMAPDGARLFGDQGLAAADRPVLMIAASEDEMILKDFETMFIFNNLGSNEKNLITFMGQSHLMIDDPLPRSWMKHFATAFFGVHLQEKLDYARFYSSGYLAAYPEFSLLP